MGKNLKTSSSEKNGRSLNLWIGNFSTPTKEDLNNFYLQQQGRISPYTPITFSSLFLQENLDSDPNEEIEVEYDYQFGQDDDTNAIPQVSLDHGIKPEGNLVQPRPPTLDSTDLIYDDIEYMDVSEPSSSSGNDKPKNILKTDLEPLFEAQFEDEKPFRLKPTPSTKRPHKPFQPQPDPDFSIQIPADSSGSPNSKPVLTSTTSRPVSVENEEDFNSQLDNIEDDIFLMPTTFRPAIRPFIPNFEPLFEVPFEDSVTHHFPKPTRKPSQTSQNPLFTPDLEADLALDFNDTENPIFSQKPAQKPMRPPNLQVVLEENKPQKKPFHPDLEPIFEVIYCNSIVDLYYNLF